MNKRRPIMITVIVAVIVVAAVVLAIQFRPTQANHPPTIISLEARPEKVTSGASCQIVCNATDPDGDQLSYEWSASGDTITGEGATVTWTAPDSAGFYDVTVTVSDGRGGEATHQIIVQVRANSSPTITSVWADAEWTLPSGSINVTCNATDPDHDELSYVWTASGGNITGAGARVVWTAPEQVGAYNITVMVSDGYGGSDTATLPVTVVTGEPPVIQQLRISKDRYGHCYLKPYSGGHYVGREQRYDIECILGGASGPVSYQWSCTGGEIFATSEDGSMISWQAPDKSVKVTITVTVSDITANMASKNLVLTVVSCSTCTFGYCSG
jgi:hypothetical protein